ncbi:hypothetical protein AVEN_262880-1 [Araneus ventricosus]|uniref:Uncharacterized protein n=1 Tax=Araneus ventricosus TaxID=182803 RepID=A0A4Y2DI46_ARAVE|nr:hypothetical protein AVEN_262880-1 [Araneus ventricosus]
MVTSRLALTCCKLVSHLHTYRDKFADLQGKSASNLLQTKIAIWDNTYAPHQTVSTNITLFAWQQKLKFADPYGYAGDFPIETFIGADFYWTVITVKPLKKLTESLVLIPPYLDGF